MQGGHVVLLLADDLGWGDLSSLGHPTSRTPHLDSLMASSVRMTSLYSASPVCSPSRAALMTGESRCHEYEECYIARPVPSEHRSVARSIHARSVTIGDHFS